MRGLSGYLSLELHKKEKQYGHIIKASETLFVHKVAVKKALLSLQIGEIKKELFDDLVGHNGYATISTAQSRPRVYLLPAHRAYDVRKQQQSLCGE